MKIHKEIQVIHAKVLSLNHYVYSLLSIRKENALFLDM